MNNFSSTARLAQLLVDLGKESVFYQEGDEEFRFTPPPAVMIAPGFFRTYVCHCCGWCCRRSITLDWFGPPPFPSERIVVQVNEHRIPVYRVINTDQKCKFLISNLCGIHPIRPFSCEFELLKTQRWSGYGLLLLRNPNRKWWVREGGTAKCDIRPATFYSYQQNIQAVEKLNTIAIRFGIKTWVPEIIETLKKINYPDFPKEKVLVGTNKI